MTPTNTPLPDLSGLKKVAQHAIPARIGGDRPSANLGGCDCQLCGEPFVGDVMHTTCEGCEASEVFRRAFTPEIALALIAKVEGLEGKEEGSAGADRSSASRSPQPLSAGWQEGVPDAAHLLEFIAYRPDAGVFPAQWHYPAHPDGGYDEEADPVLFTSGGYEDLTRDMPTHWMPLPPPPAESGPSGAQRSELAISAPDAPKSNSGADQ